MPEPYERDQDIRDVGSIELPGRADTEALGRRIGATLGAGDLVVLTGPLGAGKTALVRGIGAGMRVRGPITSPTFVIARVHRPEPGAGHEVSLVHADAYRLGGVAELDDLDLDTDLTQAAMVVEWGRGLVERMAPEYLEVALQRAEAAEPWPHTEEDAAVAQGAVTEDEVRIARLRAVGSIGDRVRGVLD